MQYKALIGLAIGGVLLSTSAYAGGGYGYYNQQRGNYSAQEREPDVQYNPDANKNAYDQMMQSIRAKRNDARSHRNTQAALREQTPVNQQPDNRNDYAPPQPNPGYAQPYPMQHHGATPGYAPIPPAAQVTPGYAMPQPQYPHAQVQQPTPQPHPYYAQQDMEEPRGAYGNKAAYERMMYGEQAPAATPQQPYPATQAGYAMPQPQQGAASLRGTGIFSEGEDGARGNSSYGNGYDPNSFEPRRP